MALQWEVLVVLVLAPAAALAGEVGAREPSSRPAERSVAIQAGLLQPIVLGGANVEVDFRMAFLVVAYSHGWSLDLQDGTIVGDMKRQGVSLHLPYSTGLGVGMGRWFPSIRSLFDVRFEAKLHRFEASYESADGRSTTEIAQYSTVTLGGGAYWTFLPFASREDALRGLDVSTSVRFWPNVDSTLDRDAVSYSNAATGRTETHRAANIGIANTPLIVNVSLGYVFR